VPSPQSRVPPSYSTTEQWRLHIHTAAPLGDWIITVMSLDYFTNSTMMMFITESGYHSSHGDDSSLSNGDSPPPFTFDSPDSMDQVTNRVNTMNLNNSSYLLMRKVTVEDLEDPKSALIKRPIRIASDPVGYGFVIRGEGPVFVKTVDPMGPAAKAGLKVGHYIYSVNDEKVVNMNHRDLAHVILAADGYLRLVVVEHPDDRS